MLFSTNHFPCGVLHAQAVQEIEPLRLTRTFAKWSIEGLGTWHSSRAFGERLSLFLRSTSSAQRGRNFNSSFHLLSRPLFVRKITWLTYEYPSLGSAVKSSKSSLLFPFKEVISRHRLHFQYRDVESVVFSSCTFLLFLLLVCCGRSFVCHSSSWFLRLTRRLRSRDLKLRAPRPGMNCRGCSGGSLDSSTLSCCGSYAC